MWQNFSGAACISGCFEWLSGFRAHAHHYDSSFADPVSRLLASRTRPCTRVSTVLSRVGLLSPMCPKSEPHSSLVAVGSFIFFLFIVDRAGRRIPWLISASVCSLCLLYLVVYTKVANTTAKVLSESTKEGGNGATAFVMIYALFWSFGGNGLPWIVWSDFPFRVRSLTGAYGAMVQWLASFVSTEAFPTWSPREWVSGEPSSSSACAAWPPCESQLWSQITFSNRVSRWTITDVAASSHSSGFPRPKPSPSSAWRRSSPARSAMPPGGRSRSTLRTACPRSPPACSSTLATFTARASCPSRRGWISQGGAPGLSGSRKSSAVYHCSVYLYGLDNAEDLSPSYMHCVTGSCGLETSTTTIPWTVLPF